MATNSNSPIIKLESVKPVVGNKPQVHPFSKPQVRPNSVKSEPSITIKSEDHRLPGLSWDMTAPEAWENKVYSIEETLGHLSNTERLTIELERFGHFTVGEEGRWTQAEVDVEWARLNALKEERAPSQPSPAFVLNRDFKPEPEYHGEA